VARYGTRLYSTFKYGEVPSGTFSVSPFTMRVIDYTKVYLYWTMPVSTAGGIIRFRLVRNQDSFPDTPEDGSILLDTAEPAYLNGQASFPLPPVAPVVASTASPVPFFRDGEENLGTAAQALTSGKRVYYAIWLLLSDNKWYLSGTTSGILASDHSRLLGGTDKSMTTHDKVMDLLPRVFTSVTNSPLDVVDTESDLYLFLSAFSYTLDELLTYIDLLKPNYFFTNLSPRQLDAKAFEFGFTSENRASSKFQRQLVREAHRINSGKGTQLSLENLIESMTGYNPTTTISPNLMLSTQDSSFTNGVGFWRTQGPGTLTVDKTTVPTTAEVNSLDLGYTGKLQVLTSGTTVILDNGNDFPITRGIPVTANLQYSFSFYSQALVSAAIKSRITWYNSAGNIVSSSTETSFSVGTSWTKFSLTATAPQGTTPASTAVYAGVSLVFPTGTYWVDLVQFALTSASTLFSEARGIDVKLGASKVNLIKNPSFENTITGYDVNWTIVGTKAKKTVNSVSMPAPNGLSTGDFFLSVTGGGSGNSASTAVTSGVVPGQFYTFSIYGKAPAGSLSQSVAIAVANSGKTTLTKTSQVTFTTSWNRFQVNIFIPSDYTTSTVTLSVSNGANTSAELYLDASQLEPGFVARDYFSVKNYRINGAQAETSTTDENNTISYMYENFEAKVPRLKEELLRFLPLGTPYIVRTQEKIEFSGFA
jgi:hypothetical protein